VSSPGGLGGKLRAALTNDQLETLLDAAAEAGQLRELCERLRSADPDLATTVRGILDEPSTPSGAAPSCQKTIEIWNGLWASWANHVAQVGEEKGPYANHVEHWHPPYFDHSALAADLEEDADKLSPWIDRAFPLVKEPDLFLQSLVELNENVGAFPDWFQTIEDNFVLGRHGTSCVLRWTWLGIAPQSKPGRKLVDLLCDLETPTQHTELNRDAVCEFFAGLPESVCREIHAYLREPRFAERLTDIQAEWHRIQHEFEGRFDPSAHLRACEEHLDQDWHYGEPLIADAVARGDFRAAEKFVELTLSSLLGGSREDPWRPEKVLLPEARYYRPPEADQALLRLIDQWEEFAGRQGKQERAASLRLQRAVRQSAEVWTEVLEAFRDYERHLAKPAKAGPLFAEWRQRMADACVRPEAPNEHTKDTWAHRLIDAQRDPASNQTRFLDDVEVWLECCRDHVAFFRKSWRSLALLTRVLPQSEEIKAACPTMYSHVLVPAMAVSGNLENSLRQALGSLKEKAEGLKVRPVWEQHLHTLVTSPGGSGSYYRESALWMKALSELNSVAYANLLTQWKTEYRRRRNLWADMASAGCPGLS
jgi:hypothetical protein